MSLTTRPSLNMSTRSLTCHFFSEALVIASPTCWLSVEKTAGLSMLTHHTSNTLSVQESLRVWPVKQLEHRVGLSSKHWFFGTHHRAQSSKSFACILWMECRERFLSSWRKNMHLISLLVVAWKRQTASSCRLSFKFQSRRTTLIRQH